MPPKGTTRIPCGTIDEMGRQKGTGKTGRARTKQVGSGFSKFDAKIQQFFGICKFLDKSRQKSAISRQKSAIEKRLRTIGKHTNEVKPDAIRHYGRYRRIRRQKCHRKGRRRLAKKILLKIFAKKFAYVQFLS